MISNKITQPIVSPATSGITDASRLIDAAFDVETSINWHTFFWAEGTLFQGEGYSNGNDVTTWPNETGESDLAEATNPPSYITSGIGGQPSVTGDGTEYMQTSAFSVDPTYPATIVLIGSYDGNTGFTRYIFDSLTSGNQNALVHTGTPAWQIRAPTAQSGGSGGNAEHFLRATFDGSSGNDTLHVDENLAINANAGDRTLDGITLFANLSLGFIANATVSLFGIYEGDLSADSNFDALKAWVTDHYGITLA